MRADISVGRVLDRYQVERFLGRGGLATVVQVRHTLLGTTHAMKLLHATSPVLVERLLLEGRVQARLRHPNLVAVTDVVPLGDEIALIMDYVAGPTLSRLLELVPLSLDERDLLADQVLRGVIAAHAEGVVHRDLKPLNVLIAVEPDALVAKVADFGLARALAVGGGPRLTLSGVAMGTPAYMAPEQHRSADAADARSDVFSLGVLLYELLTGKLPFHGLDAVELCAQAESRGYTPLLQIVPEAPPRMIRAIEAALAPEPDERPPAAEALLALWRDGTAAPGAPWTAATFAEVQAWIEANKAPPRPLATTAPVPRPGAAPGAEPAAETTPPERFEPGPGSVDAGTMDPIAFAEEARAQAARETRPRGAGLSIGLAALIGLLLGFGAWKLWFAAEPAEAPPPSSTALASAAPATQAPPPEEYAPEPSGGASGAGGPDPAATRASATEAKRSAMARVRITGVSAGELVDSEGHRFDAADPVPPGFYHLVVSSGDGDRLQVMDLTLEAGKTRRITCNMSLRRCQ